MCDRYFVLYFILLLLLQVHVTYVIASPSSTGSNIDESQCLYKGDPTAENEGCNKTLYYMWRELNYDGFLATEPSFWRYQAQTQFKLSRGLALDFAAQKCKAKLTDLVLFKSGRHGPGILLHNYREIFLFCYLTLEHIL